MKKVTNEELLKQIKELQKKVEENKQVVPYIVQQPIVMNPPCHGYCTCWQCQPKTYWKTL